MRDSLVAHREPTRTQAPQQSNRTCCYRLRRLPCSNLSLFLHQNKQPPYWVVRYSLRDSLGSHRSPTRTRAPQQSTGLLLSSSTIALFESLSLFLRQNKQPPYWVVVCFGAEREIRTLGTVLAFTRFPVVRLRPAQPSLHNYLIYLSLVSSILSELTKVNIFFFCVES